MRALAAAARAGALRGTNRDWRAARSWRAANARGPAAPRARLGVPNFALSEQTTVGLLCSFTRPTHSLSSGAAAACPRHSAAVSPNRSLGRRTCPLPPTGRNCQCCQDPSKKKGSLFRTREAEAATPPKKEDSLSRTREEVGGDAAVCLPLQDPQIKRAQFVRGGRAAQSGMSRRLTALGAALSARTLRRCRPPSASCWDLCPCKRGAAAVCVELSNRPSAP